MASSPSLTWKHIRRSPYQAIAAILVLTLTFFVISVFSLVTLGSQAILHYFETRPQVTAFFTDDATQTDIDNLITQLEAQESVASVKFVSKEEALAIYREQNKADPLLLEMVTANILPASLEVSGVSAAALPQIAQTMQGKSGVEEVVYQADVIATLSLWTRALRLGGLVLISFLVATSILVIMIIIGMKISSRRGEIEILHLIGASTGYIRNPFILEGAAYGLLSAVIAWGVTYLGLLYATPFLASFLGEIPILPVPVTVMLMLLGGQILLSLVIGSLGSLIAVRRFIRS